MDEARVILLSRLPEDLVLDVLGPRPNGFLVRVSPGELEELVIRELPFVELFDSGNAYAAAMFDLDTAQATALIEDLEQEALAALSPEERQAFGGIA